MQRYFQQIRLHAKWRARRAGQMVLAAAFALIGFGFLVAALWSYLAAEFSAIIASLSIGGLFFLAALVALFAVRSGAEPEVPPFDQALRSEFRRKQRTTNHPQPQGEGPPLMEAFLTGYETYMRMRRQRD